MKKIIFYIALSLSATAIWGQGKNAGNYFDAFITDTLFRSAHVGVSVYEPRTGRFFHSHQSEKYFVPASNLKIITCYAALSSLRDSIRLTAADVSWNDMGKGWAWDDFNEIENPFPPIPFLDCGEIWQGTVDSLLRPMMYRSDNFMAEQLLRLVSRARLGKIDFEIAIDTLLRSMFPVLPVPPKWVDGCGLSRYNLFTPMHFTTVLDKMAREFGMERMKLVFPSGNAGTLKNYYQTEANYVFAKTGTLTGVVCLSGYLYTRQNRMLIFSVLINNHNHPAWMVRRRVEKFIRELRNAN